MEKNKDIFTIGDNTNCGIIKTFEKSGDMIRVYFEDKPINYHVNLKVLEHCKQPLFTTEDGVDIFVGDDYYSVHVTSFDFPNGYGKPTIKGTAQKGYWDTFSTKEKAQEYIDLNKPKYSLNDIMNAYDRANCSFIRRDLLQEELKKLNK